MIMIRPFALSLLILRSFFFVLELEVEGIFYKKFFFCCSSHRIGIMIRYIGNSPCFDMSFEDQKKFRFTFDEAILSYNVNKPWSALGPISFAMILRNRPWVMQSHWRNPKSESVLIEYRISSVFLFSAYWKLLFIIFICCTFFFL